MCEILASEATFQNLLKDPHILTPHIAWLSQKSVMECSKHSQLQALSAYVILKQMNIAKQY